MNRHSLFLAIFLGVASQAAQAADVTVQPAAGSGFVVKDASGANERLRVQESGAISLPGIAAAAAQAQALCASAGGLLGPCSGGSGGGSYAAGTGLALSGTMFSVAPTYQLPQVCTANQVPKWSGTAWACGTISPGVTLPTGMANQTLRYDTTPALVANDKLQAFADGGLLAGGTFGTGSIPTTGAGARLMWYPAKAAFRVGSVSGAQWDNSNVGAYSFAAGADVTASGKQSTAIGFETLASGDYSVALGVDAQATGVNSVAMGEGTTASGSTSTAMGAGSIAQGLNSTAMGTQTHANGASSTAMGKASVAQGENSTAMGINSVAQGAYSTAMGNTTQANGDNSTAMGIANQANGNSSTAMGASTQANGNFSTAMGHFSVASGEASVAMGDTATTASSAAGSISMGAHTAASSLNSVAIGDHATADHFDSIAIGSRVTANGQNSIAMGTAVSNAGFVGSFIWGDFVHATPFANTDNQQFMAIAYNGFIFSTDLNGIVGAKLAGGSGSWTAFSDRNAKTAVRPVNGREVLEKVAAMPLNTWQYKTQESKYRHMGPMAQDFYAAFHLGETDRGIDTIDADGVALAAIQGLNALLAEKDAKTAARLNEKDREIATLRADKDREIAALKKRISSLESLVGDVADIKSQLALLRQAAPTMLAAQQP